MTDGLHDKHRRLRDILAGCGRLAIAFSGGADSSLLLWTALQVLGTEKVLALTGRSCLLTPGEMQRAETWPARQGLDFRPRHIFLDVDPLQWEEFAANPADRCYHCKRQVYARFRETALQAGFKALADGTNADDSRSTRPGLKAIRELDVRTPLAEAGLSKEEVRRLSREVGLDTWDHPSASCLATRIPAGLAVTKDRLHLVAVLEAKLVDSGFAGCRVRLDRHDPATACIELPEGDLAGFAAGSLREYLLNFFNDSGIKKVFLNLRGR